MSAKEKDGGSSGVRRKKRKTRVEEKQKYRPSNPTIGDYLRNKIKHAFVPETIEDVETLPSRGRRAGSPINESPLSDDIDVFIETIKKFHPIAPYEVIGVIDPKSEDPIMKELRKKVKGLKAALQTQIRNRLRENGLPTSYLKQRSGKLVLMGPEPA